MRSNGLRDLVIGLTVLGFIVAAPAATACAIVRNPSYERKAERTAFHKADMVLTVDAASESYINVPGRFAGTLRVGVGEGKVVEVHKGPPSLRSREVTYLIADGEDALSCPAFASARPGHRYKLYLSRGPGSAPPMIIYRNPFFAP